MHANDILIDGYDRIRETVHSVVADLPADTLNHRPAPGVNSISWLVWHLTRVQDDHVAEVAGLTQVWLSGGWCERFGLDLPADDTGYGHGSAEVAKVTVTSGSLLTGYFDAVHGQSREFLSGLTVPDFARVVDEDWDPPVTLGARLVSVLADDLEHAGQAAYLRGLLTAR
ncbi:mycothiol transferase [Streptomyces spiramenti]|uniref:DinB family protein n=1 Tax=Streptomyces spiramenti TaxID=2720606 RepID=A0ABX1AP40_9ACTN|nr:DinB family protein [Streptomyces spiramenti]NJP67401.1 DinB family protein [Streptomyces spiramenti]